MGVGRKVPVWQPHNTEETNTAKFIDYVNRKHHLRLQTYDDLHNWSTDAASLQTFWEDAFTWLQLAPAGSTPPGPMLANKSTQSIEMFPPPQFFPSATLNISEIVFRNRSEDNVAIHFAREGVEGIEKVTWRGLRERTRKIRGALINSNIEAGDVVAAVISNSVDTIAIALAVLSIGAIWSSTSCDLGTAGIVDRYSQVNPKIIFADDGYIYAGKTIKLDERIKEWSHKLKQTGEKKLQNVIVIPYCGLKSSISSIYKGCTFEKFLGRDSGEDLDFKMMPFSHPAFILYSSGTTGSPKCIVHSSGGVALKVKTDMTLQHDVRQSDVVFQYTTTSWVMWVLNFVNLSCSAGMLLYDGSPFHPRPTILLELAAETGVNVFGTSPRFLSELKGHGIIPREQFNLSKLRIVTSTGSVLSADLYYWFYTTAFPTAAQLISMSGGTDIAGCFVGGTPLLPIYAGEIQCKALGMAVDVLDSGEIEPVSIEASGSPGELVCTRPFPSQPLFFVGKGGREKYRSSYFDRFGPHIWCQGDYIQRLPDTGGLAILGRSDGVLNPSGVRFGSAEIYAVTDTVPELMDSICVGQKRTIDNDERVLLFVKMKPGVAFTPELVKCIQSGIRERYSPRHVPMFIFEVADIPYTVNGKKCEIVVKNIVSGRKAAVSGTVANPESLKLYENYINLPTEAPRSRSRQVKL